MLFGAFTIRYRPLAFGQWEVIRSNEGCRLVCQDGALAADPIRLGVKDGREQYGNIAGVKTS